MPYGLYISAEGAVAQSTRLETIANNLANVDTPGFKRDLALFQARHAEEIERGADYPGTRSINNVGGGVRVRETRTEFAPGPFKDTGIPTDMAIKGDGFFIVQKGAETYLTRAGNFSLTAAGELVTQEGEAVLNAEGLPVAIDTALGPWDVSHDGAIVQGETKNYLALVQPASLGDLMKVGENRFRPLAGTTPIDATRRSVVNRHLETSGVQPTLEMMHLIEASRAFEANVNLIRNQDQMLGTLINRVLRASQG